MPTYAYRCTNPECAHTFDVVQAFTDDALTECPVCGQPVRKVFSPVGVVFKGSGFYRNDARGTTATAEKGSSDGGSSSEQSAKSGGSSESKSSDSSSSSSASSSDAGSSSSSSASVGKSSSSTSAAKAS